MSTVIALHPHRVRDVGQAGPAGRLRLVREAGPAEQVVRARPALRLTPRGRRLVRLVVALAVVACVLGGVLLLSRSAEAGSQPHPVPLTYHVVLPGETLWQIAGEVAPTADRRDTVAQLRELNALGSAQLSVGQRIAVPVRTPRT